MKKTLNEIIKGLQNPRKLDEGGRCFGYTRRKLHPNRTHFFYSFDYRIEARFISKNISIDGAILGGFRRVI